MLRLLKTSVYFSTEHNACKKQVSVITKACYFQTRNIGHTRSYIYMTKESRKTLVCWLYMYVTSGLWEHLLYGVNTYIISKLQRVQNTEARLINRSKKYDHIDHTSSHVTVYIQFQSFSRPSSDIFWGTWAAFTNATTKVVAVRERQMSI